MAGVDKSVGRLAKQRSKFYKLGIESKKREKMAQFLAMRNDPLWYLKAEIAEKEKELQALKDELSRRSAGLRR